MAQPFDYGVNIPDPAQAFTQAYQMGTVITQQRLAQEEAQKKQLLQTELANLYKNPNASATDYARVAAFLPKDQAEIVTKGFERKTKEQQQTDLLMGGQVYSAIKAGSPDIAERLLTEKATALRNSGRENEAKAAENALELIKLKPELAQATIGLYMAKLPGGTEFLTNADKALATIRAEELQPAALKRALAEADKALADAITAQETAKNAPEKAAADAQRATAEAAKAAIDAKYEEQIKLADLEQKAAALGLTRAQTNQVLAQIRKLGVETQKAVLELEASKTPNGTIPEEKRPEFESKIRKEYNDQTKPYQEVKAAYGRVLSSEDTAVGDLSLIFGYMKMLDPGSVVREGEFATAQNAAGVPDRIMNIYNKVATGQRLSPSQRNSFKGQANGLYSSALEGEKTVRTGLERISKGYGLNTANIFYSATEQAPAGAPPAFVPPPSSTGMFAPTPAKTGGTPTPPAPPPGQPLPASATIKGITYPRPAKFTDLQWRNYLIAEGVIK